MRVRSCSERKAGELRARYFEQTISLEFHNKNQHPWFK
jgi:hypothetical protein